MKPLAATGGLAAVVCLSLAPLAPVLAAPALAADDPATTACRVDQTHYIDQASTLLNTQRLGFPQATRIADGKGVTVAVVDSGVDTGNGHLRPTADGGPVKKGISFVGGSKNGTSDDVGHGTAVAGIIAARKVSGSVLVGAAPAATILPVRVFDRDPTTTQLADGIRWAADHGADVINVSMSTGTNDPQLGALRDAAAYAITHGAVVVASSGNQTQEAPLTQLRFPAGFPGVVGVTATGSSGAVTDWSVHGAHVDVAAPGFRVLAPFHAAGDCLISGTQPEASWATAYVSGLAADLVEKFPKDTPEQIANRILQTADRPDADRRDDRQGWGVIQPVAALTRSTGAAPGVVAHDARTDATTGLRPLVHTPDRLAGPRRTLVWWAVGAVSLTCLALVLRPLARLRRR